MKKIEHNRAHSDTPFQDILVRTVSCKDAHKFSDSLRHKNTGIFSKLQHSKKKPNKLTTKLQVRHQRTASEGKIKFQPLIDLEGKEVVRAPKIYPNQIFSDCYDKAGNHDRIIDVSESIEVYDVQLPIKSNRNVVFN